MGKRRPNDWRLKVNPIFTLAVMGLRALPCLIAELRNGGPDRGSRIKGLVVKTCQKTMPLLPADNGGGGEVATLWAERLGTIQFPYSWFDNPEVRQAFAQLTARIGDASDAALAKGFVDAHWWMVRGSWTDGLERRRLSESILNVVALLQLQTPLQDVVGRVSNGDSALFARVFTASVVRPGDEDELILNQVLGPLNDKGAKIVGRAFLLKGQPTGYQLRLRMALFFGWDFGLCDLTIPELHECLVQMDVVSANYDPETLRRFRDRLRRLIDRVKSGQTLEAAETATKA